MSIFKKEHPRKKTVYAVTTGVFAGELLVFVEKNNNGYGFLSMPKMEIRDIPIDSFEKGIANKIVDVVEKIPNSVYKVCLLQYKKLKVGK